MQERGESSAQPEGFAQPPSWGAPPPDAGHASYYGQPGAAPASFAPPAARRPRWKTPLIAGVALVVGIAIGAAAGAGSKNDSGSSTTGTASASSSAPAAPTSAAKSAAAPAAAAPAKVVLLKLSGNGEKTTKNFTITHGDWSLAYTYDCSSFGMEGNFQVYEDYPTGAVLVNTSGTKGTDVSYVHGDNGKHSLDVSSECDWTITVTDGDGG